MSTLVETSVDELVGPVDNTPESHWVMKAMYPVALCGYVTEQPWDAPGKLGPICGQCALIRRRMGL